MIINADRETLRSFDSLYLANESHLLRVAIPLQRVMAADDNNDNSSRVLLVEASRITRCTSERNRY